MFVTCSPTLQLDILPVAKQALIPTLLPRTPLRIQRVRLTLGSPRVAKKEKVYK